MSSVWGSEYTSPFNTFPLQGKDVASISYLSNTSKFSLYISPTQLHLCVKPAGERANCYPIQIKDAWLFSLALWTSSSCPWQRSLDPMLQAPPWGESSLSVTLLSPSIRLQSSQGPFPLLSPWRWDPLGHLPIIQQNWFAWKCHFFIFWPLF